MTSRAESAGSTDAFVPRPHQIQARDAILAARSAGRPGFLLGDLTGLGKTLSAWLAISKMPEKDVLIICPKGAMPQWHRTIDRSPATGKRITMMNFERTKQLMAPPPASKRRSARAKNNELARAGSLKKSFPLVVIDESHRIRNPASQQGTVCRRAPTRCSWPGPTGACWQGVAPSATSSARNSSW